MGALQFFWHRFINRTFRMVRIKCPWCGRADYYFKGTMIFLSPYCNHCHEQFRHDKSDKTTSRIYKPTKQQRVGEIEEGNVWGLPQYITVEGSIGSHYSSGGYWSSPYVHQESWKEEKQEIFKSNPDDIIKPDRYLCPHCHGVTKTDDRGNCYACGAPKGDKQ